MTHKRRHASDEAAVMIRLEQLSQALDRTPGASSPDVTPSCATEAQRHCAKRERKLLKLRGQVVHEQASTEHLRQSLDQSFRDAACRHSSFMQWYHAQHASIDAKYAQQGLRCPWVGAADVQRRFRTSAVHGAPTPEWPGTSSCQWSIDHQDLHYGNRSEGDCGLSPSPLRYDVDSPCVPRREYEHCNTSNQCTGSAPTNQSCHGAAQGVIRSHRPNSSVAMSQRVVTFSDVPHVEYTHGGFACMTVPADGGRASLKSPTCAFPTTAAVGPPPCVLYLGATPHHSAGAGPSCDVECSPRVLETQVDHVAIQQELHRELLRQRRTSPER